jgi:hypothetical protein
MGDYTNTGTVVGTTPENATVTDSDDSSYVGVGGLTVTKTSATSYTRTYQWSISKTGDAAYDRFIGDATIDHPYAVSVTRSGHTDSDWAVNGTITIENTTPAAATITGVTDAVSDDIAPIAASVTCPVTFPYELAAGATLTCTYSAALPNAGERTNTATVTTSGPVAGGSGTAAVTFGEPTTKVRETIAVTDPLAGAQSPKVFGDDGSLNYTVGYTCPTDLAQYTNGVYTKTVDNTATITETGQTAGASVTLNCYIPAVGKTAAGTYTETHTWDVEKSVNPASQSGSPEDVLDWTWTVTVSETAADSDFVAGGAIT